VVGRLRRLCGWRKRFFCVLIKGDDARGVLAEHQRPIGNRWAKRLHANVEAVRHIRRQPCVEAVDGGKALSGDIADERLAIETGKNRGLSVGGWTGP
jgi:hypothetical protein